MIDFAFVRLANGMFAVGEGPFEQRAKPPKRVGGCFYLNDYGLGAKTPWQVPSRFQVVPSLKEFFGVTRCEPLRVKWKDPDVEPFRGAFDSIRLGWSEGFWEKAVPVVTEEGEILGGEIASIAEPLEALPPAFWPYGMQVDGEGFLGATPERLAAIEGRRLKTMALAGTAPASEKLIFCNDEKEIREHQYVASYLAERLESLGETRKSRRRLLDLGHIVHFLTEFDVELTEEPDYMEIIRLLHPTPALGPSPRSDETLTRMVELRRDLSAPETFGAPFGVLFDGSFHALVAIRNIYWANSHIRLPAGCGVISNSKLANEWEELELKRRSVKSMMGILDG